MKTRKMLALTLSCSLALSMTACAKDYTPDIIDSVNDFSENLAAINTDDIIDAIADPSSDLEENLEAVSSIISENATYSAVLDTLTWEIDEDSIEVDAKAGEASVDVTYSYADAMDAFEAVGPTGSLDELASKISSTDEMVETTVTYELILDEDTWMISEVDDEILAEIYGFIDNEFDFYIPLSADMLKTSTGWQNVYNGNQYGDTYSLDYDLCPTSDYQDVTWYYRYEIIHMENVIYSSELIEQVPGASMSIVYSEDSLIEDGVYRLVVYSGMDNAVIVDDTCEVNPYVRNLDPEDVESTDWMYDGNIGYWDDHSTFTDVTELNFVMNPTEAGLRGMWKYRYEYYLNGELIMEGTQPYGNFSAQYCPLNADNGANMDSTGNYLAPGTYSCLVYTLSGHLLASDNCTIISSADGAGTNMLSENAFHGAVGGDFWQNHSTFEFMSNNATYSSDDYRFTYDLYIMNARYANLPIYYEIYYESPTAGSFSDGNWVTVSSGTIAPVDWGEGSWYYEVYYEAEDHLLEGTYHIIFTPNAMNTATINVSQCSVS
ncbi:MAG: hypothetical protein MJ094_01500 [Saccharofermentans sp.]|nr:hypothetical protein [Saccharofermentans sp.]